MPVIGFLRSSTASGSAHLVVAFRQGLTETGFVEGQNVAIEYRWSQMIVRIGCRGLAADLAARQVALIVGQHGLGGAGCQGSNYDNTDRVRHGERSG